MEKTIYELQKEVRVTSAKYDDAREALQMAHAREVIAWSRMNEAQEELRLHEIASSRGLSVDASRSN